MDPTTITAIIVAITAAIVLILIFNGKAREVAMGALRVCIAYGGLILFNMAGGAIGFTVGANILNAAIAGLLGLPGVAVILFMKWMFPVA